MGRRLVTADMLMTKMSFFYMQFKFSMRNSFFEKNSENILYIYILKHSHLRQSQKKY